VEKFLLQRPLARVLAQLAVYGLIDPRVDGKPGLSQGTLTGGLKRISVLVQVLYQRILAETRGADHWHMDETRWLVFVEIEGKKGYRWWLWVVVTQTTVCYLLDPSRSSDVPRGLLEGAEGILSVDRYSAYKAFAAGEDGIQLAYCWTHVRRDFKRVLDTHKKPSLKEWAQGWVERISLIFKLNRERPEVREDAEAFAQRDHVLRTAVEKLKERAEGELAAQGLHKAQEKPLNSMLNHWDGLLVFVDNPDVPMDNSEAERQLREAALGRKNYYGSGAEWSGHLTASLLWILRTAQRNGVNPALFLEVYLEACARNGGKAPANIDDFLSWNLSAEIREAIARKAQHEEHVEVPP
jgi:transposase